FKKQNRESLEAAIKYLIFGAVSSAFLIFGIALVYGTSGTMAFSGIAKSLGGSALHSAIFHTGLGMILVGLGFKIAMVPFQLWVPDVYQGAPSPTTAFLATGSKAAGFVLIIRLFLNTAEPAIELWREQLIVIAILTILYGNLCAIPQRNIKRLIGYSSIAHAGYLLMGVATIASDGIASILYYLVVYMLAVVAMFGVIAVLFKGDDYDIGKFSGLHQRSPFLAMIMTIALASLAGIPPLAGFFGKFLLIKSAALQVNLTSSYYYLVAIAIIGVAISIYYYFKIIKLIYWGESTEEAKISISYPLVILLALCAVGMLYYGIIPSELVDAAKLAARSIAM
ncbi:MAG TPA: NADH-quinone oxidoreductase subunit N, partial [Verrucomicrobiota bacterium]|nr:NADH-quinone oxidoreductase subunit N [Verrucomicrobiota bacterium]